MVSAMKKRIDQQGVKKTIAGILSALALLIVSLMAGSSVWAGSKTGADFLKIPIGARAVSLGQATTALASGVEAMNWNPAGIAHSLGNRQISLWTIGLSHQVLFEGNNLDNVNLVKPVFGLLKGMSIGFSATRLSYPDQDRRNANREKTGSFGASDMAVGGALAATIGHIQCGTHVKLIQQKLESQSATGVALDLGILSATPLSKLTVGGSIQNLGNKMKFLEEEYNLPLTLSTVSRPDYFFRWIRIPSREQRVHAGRIPRAPGRIRRE